MESKDREKRVAPTAEWDNVKVLKIQSPSGRSAVRVFPNGAQRCEVNVIVSFTSGPNDIAITREEAFAATSLAVASTHDVLFWERHGFGPTIPDEPSYMWSEDIMDLFSALPAAIDIAGEAYESKDLLSRLNTNQMIVTPSSPLIEWDPHWLLRQVPNTNNKIVRTLLENLKSKPIEPSPLPHPPRAVESEDKSIRVLEHTLTFYILAKEGTIGNLDIVACVTRPDGYRIYSNEISPRSIVSLQAIPLYRPSPTSSFQHNTAKGEFIFSPRQRDRENFVWEESAIQMTVGQKLISFRNSPYNIGMFQMVWSDEFYAGVLEWEWGVFHIGGASIKDFEGCSFSNQDSCYYTRYLNHPENPLRNIRERSLQLSGGSFSPPPGGGIPIGKLCSTDNDWILDINKRSFPHHLNSDEIRVVDEFGTWHSFRVQVADVATLVLIRNW